MIRPIDDKPVLTRATIEEFESIILESIDTEYQRFIFEKEAHRVFDYLLELYSTTDYYAFFIPSNLAHLAENIFEDISKRRFILNVTDRVLLHWPHEDALVAIIEHVADRYSRTKNAETATIMPEDIKLSIAMNKEILKQCLLKDVWLLIVFYISLILHRAAIFKAAITK